MASSSCWSTTTTSLNPAALRMVVAVIQEHPDADVIYTDEMSVDTSGGQLSLILKPDWSPEYLLAAHYFNHLTAYRRQLVTEVGGFNPDYVLRPGLGPRPPGDGDDRPGPSHPGDPLSLAAQPHVRRARLGERLLLAQALPRRARPGAVRPGRRRANPSGWTGSSGRTWRSGGVRSSA